MARVKLNCKCDLCGNMFEHIKFLSSREQADAFMRVLRTEAEKANMSDDEMLIQTLKSYGLFKLYICLTETSVEKLLQELT